MTADHNWHEDVTRHNVQIEKLEESDMRQDKVIEKIRNRLPHWATLLIAILMGVIGFLAKGGID